MSERVCYIRRSDRGGALKGLRLLSGHSDDTWHAGGALDPGLISRSIEEGARWIRDRLDADPSKNTKSRSLALLCLDPDGAVCSWVKPDDADPTLLEDAIAGASAPVDMDALEPETHSGIGDRFPQMPLELSFEFLDQGETSTGSRAAVMAAPDVVGRLIKDQLDTLGVRVEKVTTIWHAIADVWDPGSGSATHSAQRIVSSDAPICAIIAIDAQDARLIWSWSREGRLIAAGSVRIAVECSEQTNQALIRSEDIARICSDWLGWSSQLGVAPSRIVFLGKPTQIKNESSADQSDSGTDEPAATHRGLSAAQIGAALNRGWAQSTIDLIELDDPIGECLSKIASGQRGRGLVSLSELGSRPGRAHRSMYRWAGLGLVAVSAIITLLSYQLFEQAGQIKGETSTIKNTRMELIISYDPALAISPFATMDLQTKLDTMRQSQGPLLVAESKPILEELETISFVLGIPGIEVTSIKLNNAIASVVVRVEDIAQAEGLYTGLRSIDGSHLRWRAMTPKTISQRIQATYDARWREQEDEQ